MTSRIKKKKNLMLFGLLFVQPVLWELIQQDDNSSALSVLLQVQLLSS